MIHENVRERLDKVSKMHQEPKDRLWGVIFVLIAMVVVVGAIVVGTNHSMRNYLETGRELGFERGSVECLSLVVDNDRTFPLPAYCGRHEVVVFYPSEVCVDFFPDSAVCGKDWEGE